MPRLLAAIELQQALYCSFIHLYRAPLSRASLRRSSPLVPQALDPRPKRQRAEDKATPCCPTGACRFCSALLLPRRQTLQHRQQLAGRAFPPSQFFAEPHRKPLHHRHHESPVPHPFAIAPPGLLRRPFTLLPRPSSNLARAGLAAQDRSQRNGFGGVSTLAGSV